MPKIGETRRANEIGYKGDKRRIWAACIDCGKGRWTQLKSGEPISKRCHSCSQKHRGLSGSMHPYWKGGRILYGEGYVKVWLSPKDFFYPMADKKGYVLEHRLVMAKHLGRCLQPWEIVHHKGIRHSGIKNKSDNLRDNLELSSGRGEHSSNHSKGYRDGYSKGYYEGKTKRIRELESKVKKLEKDMGITFER